MCKWRPVTVLQASTCPAEIGQGPSWIHGVNNMNWNVSNLKKRKIQVISTILALSLSLSLSFYAAQAAQKRSLELQMP